MGFIQPHLLVALCSILAPPVFAAEQTAAPGVAPVVLKAWPGPWRMGFSVGAPAVLNARLDTVISPDFEAGLAWGGVILPLPSFVVTQWNIDATFRYFHLGKYFFVGVTLRYLGVGIDGRSLLVKTDEISTGETPEFRMGGLYAIPQLGLRFRIGKSMTLGFDVGLQLAFYTFGSIHSSRLTAPVGDGPSSIYQELDRASRRPLSWMARIPVPTVSLFTLSWDL